MRVSVIGGVLLFVSGFAITATAENAPATRTMSDAKIVEETRADLDRLSKEDKFSGVVLIAKEDKILFERAYGYADHAFNARNNIHTKFNLGSMGKMFTAVSILQLVEAGKLSLDAKLIDVLPDYPDKDIASKITIYQLLTHTSGLGDMFTEKFEATPKNKLDTVTAHLPLFTGNPLLFEPGTKWSYSNAGFIVLGLVIEKISGQSYYDYVRQHVFKPAGMTETDNYKLYDDVPNLALGYTRSPDSSPGSPRRINTDFLQPGASAGGGYSTVGDLLKFAHALENHVLLNEHYTDLDMTGKIAMPVANTKYAFGMTEAFVNGVRIVGHSGGGPGISSDLDMYPGLGYTVAVMTNYDGASSLVYQKLRLELSGEGLPHPIHLSADALNAFSGNYSAGASSDMQIPPLQVAADHDGLSISFGRNGAPRQFLPVSQTEFFDSDNPSARVAFTKDQNGNPSGLTAVGFGPGQFNAQKTP